MNYEIHWKMKNSHTIMFLDAANFYFYKYILVVFILFTGSEIILTALLSLTLRMLQKTAHLYSSTTYKMHLQFSLLLGAQLFSPIFFVLLPIIGGVACYLLEIGATDLQDEIGILSIVAYGASNSLLTIG
jgi:hypothetical protein